MAESLKCIIIDDEPPAIKVLKTFVGKMKNIELLTSTTDALEGLDLIKKHNPDLVFLDIQMPDLTGIQLSKMIGDSTNIIFTTAYTQFAIEGFQVNAVDYLLKPIAFPRFIEAVEKVKKKFSSEIITEIIQSDDYFFVKTDGKNRFQKVKLDEILFAESIKNYVVIHTKNEQLVTYNTLKKIQQSLPEDQFIKIHKSYIVALNKIKKTDTSEVWIDGKNLPLGDTYRAEFFKEINTKKL
ncbi:LytR/AlgR family response regulator transcription factor [Zunongwangia endophytica]|uniref:LytR/AlgR family response regulator transcription factor n=1 Tax=Zunongwangia endophytica TaxID=1808945 RepID=A0ABV8H6C7_9FLAO|nr:LytTR family DNA-binding domain-containing protein [Zunongwangia endophytica]MDN3596088.1 LytTR family DNA-binding domain-containing protein [Zunongwangia endophytica]